MCWWVCGEIGTLIHRWWDCNMVQPLLTTVWQFLKELNIELPYCPAITILGRCMHNRNVNICPHRNLCSSIIHNNRKMKTTQMPINRSIFLLRSPFSTEYLSSYLVYGGGSVLKRNEGPTLGRTEFCFPLCRSCLWVVFYFFWYYQ